MRKFSQSDVALDARARRAAKRVGLHARKSRARSTSINNYGGYMLIDNNSIIVVGERFDLDAQDVINYCME